MVKTILAIGAHNDDHVIGAGGALVKYAREGYRVRTIICSFGEKSHPHLKPEVIIERRVKESFDADKVMGGSGVAYLGLHEGSFDKEIRDKKIVSKLARIIADEKPCMIFTHGIDDVHPDHRSVFKLVSDLMRRKKIVCPVYAFEVWSLFKLRRRNVPRMVVDVSDTFNVKIKAFLLHESQTLAIWMLLWKVILGDLWHGFLYDYRYAEVFYRL